jgi:protein TonB
MTDIRADAPAEVRFLFQDSQKRVSGALGVSVVVHALIIALVIFVAIRPAAQAVAAMPEILDTKDIIWLLAPGPGGGGGGSAGPLRQVSPKPQPQVTPPIAKPVDLAPPKLTDAPTQTLDAIDISALPAAAAGESFGANFTGGGGTGTGIGSGTGSGLGPGSGGGTGGGVFQPGNGVLTPKLLTEVKPQYTAQAMRAKIQGTVLLQCVVQPDGTVANITIVRSLDSAFGLDQEAVKAARQWRFAPGTRLGQPVAVQVTIEIAFTLR